MSVRYSTADELTTIENESIVGFLLSVADEGYLSGSVLDIGSGREPYKQLILDAGGTYTPYDSPRNPCSVARKDTTGKAWGRTFDTLLVTQVIQFVEDAESFLRAIRRFLAPVKGGHLVLSYGTNWPEVNEEDLRRYTRMGMNRLLAEAGWHVLRHERRATFHAHGYEFAMGYGVVARA